jgi:hypothetical protein
MKYCGNNISRCTIDLPFPLWEDKNYTNRVMVCTQRFVKQVHTLFEYTYRHAIAYMTYTTVYLQRGALKILIYRKLNKTVKRIWYKASK